MSSKFRDCFGFGESSASLELPALYRGEGIEDVTDNRVNFFVGRRTPPESLGIGTPPNELFRYIVDNINDEGALLILIDIHPAEAGVPIVGMTAERGRTDAKIGQLSFRFRYCIKGDAEVRIVAALIESLGKQCLLNGPLDTAVNDGAEYDFLVVGTGFPAVDYKAAIATNLGRCRTVVVDVCRGNAGNQGK